MSAESQEPAPVPEKSKARLAYFEPLALVLLSLATVGTAWCSYQAATWGGVAQRHTNQAMASARTAAANELQAQQVAVLDVLLFSQYINARASSNEVLARFYSDRFRGEAKTAFQAWLATRPFDYPSAPAHPFLTNFYQPKLLTEAREAESKSESLLEQAGNAGRTSRSYVLVTVLLACAPFCGGTAAKFDTARIRLGLLALGLFAFLAAMQKLAMLPAQF